jgi:hypothetical protein
MVIIRVAPKLAAYQPERQQIVFPPPQKPGWCVAPRRYRTIDGAILGIGDCSRCAEYPVDLFSTTQNVHESSAGDGLGTRIYVGGVTQCGEGAGASAVMPQLLPGTKRRYLRMADAMRGP